MRGILLCFTLTIGLVAASTGVTAQEPVQPETLEPGTGAAIGEGWQSLARPVGIDEWSIVARVSAIHPDKPTVTDVVSDYSVVILDATTPLIPAANLRPTADGVFDLGRSKLPGGAPVGQTHHTVTVRIEAMGYAPFIFRNVPLVGGITHEFTPLVGQMQQTDDLAVRRPTADLVALGVDKAPLSQQSTCTSAQDYALPQSIKVYQNYGGPGNAWYTPDFAVHSYDLKFYVAHVLGREIGSTYPATGQAWPIEAVRANAMAVKNYSWHRTRYGYGGFAAGSCYDVDTTTNYQVFDPYYTTSAITTSVNYIWPWLITNGNAPYEALYKSGSVGDGCGEWFDQRAPGNDLSQNGSGACALAPFYKNWLQILYTYYFSPSFILRSPPAIPSTTLSAYTGSATRLNWSAVAGVTYRVCTASNWANPCSSGAQVSGIPVTVSVPSTNDGERYARIFACGSDGYCQAGRAGGIKRSTTNFNFYATAHINGSSARVYVRNMATIPSSHEFYEGVPAAMAGC